MIHSAVRDNIFKRVTRFRASLSRSFTSHCDMKILRLPLLGGLALLALSVASFAESAQELLTQAQVAYQKGEVETAKKLFKAVLQADPRNPTAISFLKLIAGVEKKKPAGASTQKQLEGLIVPKVEFKEATLGSVLDFLKQTAAKVSDGKTAVNFVVQLPEDQVKKTVTLSLTNVPMSEVLRYLGGLADIDFTYEKYAVLVKPHVAAPQTAPAQQ